MRTHLASKPLGWPKVFLHSCCFVAPSTLEIGFVARIVARIGNLDGEVVPVGGARGCVPSK